MSTPLPQGRNLFPWPRKGHDDEEKDMFTTDSFLGAEITYRQEKIRQDYRPVRRWIRGRGNQTEK